MKRHNMWGSNPIRKYVRLSSNSERGEDGGHSIPGVNYIHTMNNTKEVRKPALLPTPHDVLLKGHTDPTRADGGHTSSIRPEKPGLLPTPVTKTFQTKSGLFPSSRDTVGSLQSVSRPTSGPPQSVSRPTIGSPQSVSRPTSGSPQSVSRPTIGSPQSVSRPTIGSPQSVSRPTSGPLVVKSEETKIKPQNVNISKCDNGSELDVLLPTKTNPTTSPYFPNLDEFLMSNSEDELPIKDQPHNKETTDTLSEVGGNISGGNNVGETKKNAHVSCSFIDRKRYQSGPGYDDILRMANENVKKQRRLSQQDHVHKQDNSTTATNKVLQRSNSASPKKKKVHESPKKLLDTCTKRKEQLVIVPEVQVKLRQKGMLKICLNKLNIASETIKLSEEQETSEHDNTERRSLFQSFSNNEEIQSIVNERLEEIFMDTSETLCHDLPPPADNTEVPQDTIQNPADKKREEFGLFDRFRSSVTVSPSQTQNETSQDSPPKNNSPKKNLCKINLLNFKKLKEKVSTSASSIMQIKSELEPIPCDPGSVPDTHQPITKEKDDSLDIISSDDDDDDLPEPSLFLGNDTKRSKLENTTEIEISFSQDSLSDSLYNNSINETEPEPDRFKLSLDSMVQNKQKNELKNAELQKMTEDLQGDLKTNLMDEADNLDDSTSNYILPDHKRKLDNFANPTNHMPDMYPGDEIFNLNQLGNIFSFPSTLRLADCGFIPVRGKATDDLLWKASPDNLVGVIDSCLLVEAHLVKPCQDSLMLWIFYFMSIHGKVHTIMQAFRTMWSLMNNSIRFNQSRVWLPTLKQITRVLLNYGASFEGLFPAPGLEPSFTLNEVVNESGKGKENMVEEGTENSTKNQSWTTKRSFPTVGLNHVMKIITHGMLLREKYKQPVFYTEDELMQLVGLVCRVALETKAKDDTLGEDFMLCSSSIIDAFSQQSWSSKCKELCRVLPGLTTHHHNLVHLVDLFPTFTDRGRSIRRLLSYYAILKLMSEDRPAGSVKIKNEYLTSEELRVFHLFPILNSIHLTEKTDYYQLYSLIVIVNTCIGNEKLPGNEKSDLYKLADKLHRINTKIKVSPNYPSMSKVKHILQRLQIKFKIMADSMVTKQFDVSTYVCANLNDTPVEHLIESKDSDVESADDDDNDDDDNDDDAAMEIHCQSVSSIDCNEALISDTSHEEANNTKTVLICDDL
ncbi:uncharacterized protein [Antedon mediterranea]|uniref:uncharacterized protein n=1 Tax=Antedon mediterranea TaxID=105859 RepID=UPI003AF8217B